MSKSLQRPSGFEGCRFGEASLPGRKPAAKTRCFEEVVPVPPKTGKPHAPRGRHDRLRGGHLKGMTARDNLRELIQGSDPKLGRWSKNKAVYTELLQVMQTCSIPKLISTLSQAQAAGAYNWPEFAKASGRLKELEEIRHNMEEACGSVCIDDMERLICRASAVGICRKSLRAEREQSEQSIEPEFQHLVSALEKRMHKLRILREDLRICAQSLDMELISNTLKVAEEFGAGWEDVRDARVRLRMLQSSLAEMTELLGSVSEAENCYLKEKIHEALMSFDHIEEDAPPPLGWVLNALRVQYNRIRLEGVAGLRDRLTREILAAGKDANLELLRAAVAEADTQFYSMDSSKLPDALHATRWDELEHGRRCLAQLVEIEAELELVVTPSTIPPSPAAIIAAIARADAAGCSTWTLRSAASTRLRQVQSLEASILKAVAAGSEDLLREAMINAQCAGFVAWPLLNAATELFRGFKETAGQEECALLWQSFISTTAQRLLAELAEGEPFGGCAGEVADVEVAFVGIRLESECPEMLPMEMLLEMFEKATGEPPHTARVTSVRSGLAVLEVRLKGLRERFDSLVAQLRDGQVLDFGRKVKVAKHLYSFVARWKDQEHQLAMLSQTQRASSPGETSSTPISLRPSTVDLSNLTQDVIHKELELLREFATPAGASALYVKATSPDTLVEDVVAGTSELLVEEVVRKQIADGVTSALNRRRDDSISVVSEATDIESVQLLRLIQTEFQAPQEALVRGNQAGQEEKSKTEDAGNIPEALVATGLQEQKPVQNSRADQSNINEDAQIANQLNQDWFAGVHHSTIEERGIPEADAEVMQVACGSTSLTAADMESLTKPTMDVVVQMQNGGCSPLEEMSCSSGPDDFMQDFVARNVLKNAFGMLQDTDEGIGNSSDISELSIERDPARDAAHGLLTPACRDPTLRFNANAEL